MAVTLNFNVCESCNNQTLTFTETTGAYSASNTSGWGSPNRLTSEAETATLSVTTPAGTTTVLNLFTSSFPTTNEDLEFEISPDDVGYSAATGTKFPDGAYTFVYTVGRTTATAFSYVQTKTILIYGQIQCEVFGLYGDIPQCDCECDSDVLELAFKASTFLEGLKYAAQTGNSTDFDNIMTILERLTANNDCNNC